MIVTLEMAYPNLFAKGVLKRNVASGCPRFYIVSERSNIVVMLYG